MMLSESPLLDMNIARPIKSSTASTFPLLGNAPKGVDDLCFHTGEFSPSPSSVYPPGRQTQSPASRPKSQSRGPNPSLQVQIPASGQKYQPPGPNLSLQTKILASRTKFQPRVPISALRPHFQTQGSQLQPGGLILSPKAPIPTSRPQFGSSDSRSSNKNSTGHRLLRGLCPSNHLIHSYRGIGYR